MTQQHTFQVDLRGILDLLANHLYSGPHVFVREMLQNAVDAIAAREQLDPAHRGEISLQLVPGVEGGPPTLVVRDNGIGLTEEGIHRFLATIGQSSKRQDFSRADFLGQFGIGLLSAFMVSDEIVVLTRSAQDGASTFQWKGQADGTYSITPLKHEIEPGTEVYLRAKAEYVELFEPESLLRQARHYGGFLPHQIELTAGERRFTINETPPWEMPLEAGDELRQTCSRMFETEFLDVIPLDVAVAGLSGFALVLPASTGIRQRQHHRVYLKRMLLSERVDNLLPEWAFFVTCVVNVSDLRPTASREAFYEDERLAATRTALGESLRRYLLQLAEHEPQRFAQLMDRHFLAMKALAVEDDEFFRVVADLLPFETSLGDMTLGEYRRRSDVVRYIRSVDQFRQLRGVAAAQSLCILNAGYTFDEQLIDKLGYLETGIDVEPVDAGDLIQQFDELSLDERDKIFDFIRLAEQVLQSYRCAVDVRQFKPAELPALYTISEETTFLRSIEQSQEQSGALWEGVLGNIKSNYSMADYSKLCLNYGNPLVRKLSGAADRQAVRRCVEMLYVQSLLLGHYPLGRTELEVFNTGLAELMDRIV